MSMGRSHYKSTVAILFLYELITAADGLCMWNVDITRSSAPTTEAIFIEDTSLLDSSTSISTFGEMSMSNFFTSQGGPRSYPYMLRIMPNCVDQLSADEARRYAFSGGSPRVHVIEGLQISNNVQFLGATTKSYEGALINLESMLGFSSYNFETFAWVTPLELHHQSSVIKVKIETSAVTTALPRFESHILSVSGFVESGGSRPSLLGSSVTDAISGSLMTPLHIHAIPHVSPTLAMVTVQSASTPRYILSEDMFATYTSLETPAFIMSEASKCPCSDPNLLPSKELDIVSLPDRLLYLSVKGVTEVLGNMIGLDGTQPSSFSETLVYNGCARSLEIDQQLSTQQKWVLTLMGGCSDINKIFQAPHTARNGKSIQFTEVLDRNGQRICDASGYASSDCSVVAAVPMALSTAKISVLLEHQTSSEYTFWKMSGSTWTKISTIPNTVPSTISLSPYLVNTSPPVGGVSYNIKGISVSQKSSADVALWGNRLLLSQDLGVHIFLVQDISGSNIIYFASSLGDWYAFLTDRQEVWIGEFGQMSLKKIYPTSAWDVILCDDAVAKSAFTIVSLLFDQDSRLYMMLVKDGGSDITRIDTKLFEVLSFLEKSDEYSSSSSTNIFDESLTHVGPAVKCPFLEVAFELNDLSWYNKAQDVLYRKPMLFREDDLHRHGSVLLYQTIVHSLNNIRENFHKSEYIGPYNDFLTMWKSVSTTGEAYYFYLFENSLGGATVNIDPHTFNLETVKDNNQKNRTHFIPDLVYMDRNDVLNITVYIQLIDDETGRFQGDEAAIKLGTRVADTNLVSVVTYREYLPLNHSVKYLVELKEMNGVTAQNRPGVDLATNSFTMSILGSPFDCIDPEVSGHRVHKMTVLHGCPPTQRIGFNPSQTKNVTVENGDRAFDCYFSNPDLPCFYFYNAFYPVFMVMDTVTGEQRQWLGNYTLKIIGGGKDSAENIEPFTEEDVFRYNSLTTGQAALIMSPIKNSYTNGEGWVVYNGNDSGITWFCQAESPCSLIFPKLPRSSEYCLLVEFSNKDVDSSSYCDYTMQFVIHLHGIPINSIAFSAPLVLVSALAICAWFGLYFYYEVNKKKIKRELSEWWERTCYSEKSSDEDLDQTLTNEELEELGSKDWKKALQIKVAKLQAESQEEFELPPTTLPLPNKSKTGPTSSVTSAMRTPRSSSRRLKTKERRRTSVGIGAALDGRVSIMEGSIEASEIMRLRTLNRVYLHNAADKEKDQ